MVIPARLQTVIQTPISPSELEHWFKAPYSELEALFSEAQRITEHHFKRQITLYAPGKQFPSISITGHQCQLQCCHCEGHFLKHMHALSQPNELLRFCQQLAETGGIGCLISGGCRPDGTIPFQPFLPIMSQIKATTHLTLNVHTGFLSLADAHELANTGIDCASVDIVGHNDTIRSIYGLSQRSTHDYEMTLKALKSSGVPAAPHICVGLDHGRLRGELQALRLIRSIIEPRTLVLIAFMPTKGTAMAKDLPAQPEDVARMCALARLLFPQSHIALGCMRPRGLLRQKTEELVIRAGVTRLVQPTKASRQLLQENGFSIRTETTCCVV